MHEDPVLAAHHVANNCFEIGGAFTPASIRDQMVRAYLVVDRAIKANLIGHRNRRLLVIGAGPTGLTAAVHAARCNVPTVLIDRQPNRVLLLSPCHTRDVEPTLYDWPTDHWGKGKFPWDDLGEGMPFEWTSGRASEIAALWDEQFMNWRDVLGEMLDVRLGTSVDFKSRPPRRSRGRQVDISLFNGGREETETFGAVVACGGWGEEICEVEGSTFRGFRFWESDPLELPDFDLGRGAAPPILISGGGDGALQDFIRVITGRGTGEVFAALRTDPAFMRFLDSVTNTLFSAEDVARRALIWNLKKEQDEAIFSRLEQSYQEAFDAFRMSDASGWQQTLAAVASMQRSPTPDVRICHPKSSFPQCYPLNRLLALLLLRVCRDGTRMTDTKVSSVRGQYPHTCASDPEDCHGEPHLVEFETGNTSTQATFEVVILRHGLRGPTKIFERKLVRLRQILPYYVPEQP